MGLPAAHAIDSRSGPSVFFQFSHQRGILTAAALISALQNKRRSRGNNGQTELSVDKHSVEAVGGGRGGPAGRLYGSRVLAASAADQASGPPVRADRTDTPGDDRRGPFQSLHFAPGGAGFTPGRGRWHAAVRGRQTRRGTAMEIPDPACLEFFRHPHHRTEREPGDRARR